MQPRRPCGAPTIPAVSLVRPRAWLPGARRARAPGLSRTLTPTLPGAARLSPRRLEALSAGFIDLARLAATAGPTSSYVAPADRYAVVPGGPPSPAIHSGMAVPEMPETKRQRA